MDKIIKAIKEEASRLNIDKIGFTGAEDLIEEKNYSQDLLDKNIISGDIKGLFESKNNFFSPRTFMPEGKSIIMALLNYYEETEERESKEPAGEIALYTRRNNYKFLRKKLQKLGKFIKNNFNGNFRVFVNGPLAEKPLAKRAGLGHYGKNGIIYNKKFGSRIILGGIITDLELPAHKYSSEDICKNCSACINSCPTGAIINPYTIDNRKCIQYLSQFISAPIPDKYKELWGTRLYGCSTCQDVCPLNKSLNPAKKLSPYGVIGAKVPLIPIINMKEEEFREKYKGNQISAKWVNFEAIKRNALIALNNWNKNNDKKIVLKKNI